MVFFKGLHRWLPNHPKRQGGGRGRARSNPVPITGNVTQYPDQ